MVQAQGCRCALQMAEAALADEWVRHGERLALQRRVLRLGKPPRRWRKPAWAAQVRGRAPPDPAPRADAWQPLQAHSAALLCPCPAGLGYPTLLPRWQHPHRPAQGPESAAVLHRLPCGWGRSPAGQARPQPDDAAPACTQASRDPPEVRITAHPLPNVLGLKSRFRAADGSELTVEQLALEHYASDEGGGWTGGVPGLPCCRGPRSALAGQGPLLSGREALLQPAGWRAPSAAGCRLAAELPRSLASKAEAASCPWPACWA